MLANKDIGKLKYITPINFTFVTPLAIDYHNKKSLRANPSGNYRNGTLKMLNLQYNTEKIELVA